MKYIYHADSEPVAERVDLTLYVVPPNRAFRFESDFHAQIFVEHKHYHGIVFVDETLDEDTGQFQLNLEKAKHEAKALLEVKEREQILTYVRIQQEDRLRFNLPAIPPSERLAGIIKKRGVDLGAEYGIFPIGWGKSQATVERERELEQLRAENKELKSQFSELMSRIGNIESALK